MLGCDPSPAAATVGAIAVERASPIAVEEPMFGIETAKPIDQLHGRVGSAHIRATQLLEEPRAPILIGRFALHGTQYPTEAEFSAYGSSRV